MFAGSFVKINISLQLYEYSQYRIQWYFLGTNFLKDLYLKPKHPKPKRQKPSSFSNRFFFFLQRSIHSLPEGKSDLTWPTSQPSDLYIMGLSYMAPSRLADLSQKAEKWSFLKNLNMYVVAIIVTLLPRDHYIRCVHKCKDISPQRSLNIPVNFRISITWKLIPLFYLTVYYCVYLELTWEQNTISLQIVKP